MSESLDGFRVAATRQNAGRSANGCAADGGAAAPASVNAPGPTVCARVMVVFGSVREARFSHDPLATTVTPPSIAPAPSVPAMRTAEINARFIQPPYRNSRPAIARRQCRLWALGSGLWALGFGTDEGP